MALRPDFKRFALSIQYHGSAFLGFSYQGSNHEDCILSDGTDLRGHVSVEGRLRQALTAMLGDTSSYTNIQVSSRTDRGVHAIQNTLHFDLRDDVKIKEPDSIKRALNYYISQHSYPHVYDTEDEHHAGGDEPKHILTSRINKSTQVFRNGYWVRHSPGADLRVLRVLPAPTTGMPNPWGHAHFGQPAVVDWNARFSTIDRTYLYRILHTVYDFDWANPFEWDRALRVNATEPLQLEAMRTAAKHLVGEYDSTSFQSKGCKRKSPIVNVREITIADSPYVLFDDKTPTSSNCRLVSIRIRADSFLYHQVRNMVGCLLQVGRGVLSPNDVLDIRMARDRSQAPMMVPAHGLFLSRVRHQGIEL